MNDKFKTPIGILGGTFDPVHLGHIQIAQQALALAQLKQIRFIPCYQPAHRALPTASPEQRLKMLTLAIADAHNPNFIVDDREINRHDTSYTITTLKELRTELPDTPLCFILGFDSFASLSTWHQFSELLQHAHFIVFNRTQAVNMPPEVAQLLSTHEVQDPKYLHDNLTGKIYPITIAPILTSATEIRQALHNGDSTISSALSKSVYDYIQAVNLYR